MSYRIEASKTKQAGCQNKPCKDEGIKIQKGELRFGSWVVVHEHGSFRWRHWGCVSGKILENLRQYLEQGDPGTGYKWDYFDGLDELEPSDQEKVKKAVIEGKIADEDWKGDPEFNVLGQSGTVKKAPRKRKAKAGENEEEEEEADTSPDAEKKIRDNKAKSEADDNGEVKPDKKSRTKKAKIEVEGETKPAVKRESKVKTEIKDENDDNHSVPALKPKSRTRRAVKNEPMSGDEEATGQKAATKKKNSKTEAVSSDAEVNMDDIPHKKSSTKNRVKSDDEQEDIKPAKGAPKKTPLKKNSKASVKTENGDGEVEDVKPVKATTTKKKSAPKKKLQKEESESESEEAEVKPAVSSRADRAAKRAASDLNENKKLAKKNKTSAEGQAGAFDPKSDEDDAIFSLDEDLDDGSGSVAEPVAADKADNDKGFND